MERDTPHDAQGVFTGCFVPTDLHGQADSGVSTCICTSISNLPVHYTMPYTPGSEPLSYATSTDGGCTWAEGRDNPIVPALPEDLDITWRDPYVATWPALSEALGLPEDQLFGCLAGGIRHETPSVFYFGNNFRPSRWSRDLGINWEVTNFFQLPGTDTESRKSDSFIIPSCEGCKDSCSKFQTLDLGVTVDGRAPDLGWSCGGTLDYGAYYTGNSFWDPTIREQAVLGWLAEEDLPGKMRHPQGWSGCLSLPSLLKNIVIHNAVKARRSDLAQKGLIKLEPRDAGTGTATLKTLAMMPHPNLSSLRKGTGSIDVDAALSNGDAHGTFLDVRILQWEADLSFAVGRGCESLDLTTHHSHNSAHKTTLEYYPDDELFIVNRSVTSTSSATSDDEETASRVADAAPHTPFTISDPATNEVQEELPQLCLSYDQSVLEVFLNERTVPSTKLYPPAPDRGFGITMPAQGPVYEAEGTLATVKGSIWDGLKTQVAFCD
ncbi:beta-fructofuranosidase [Geosmithia morbida]|uniref:Beta-fructofuranosidase n=1 Tax=Geosmithia morbida TaxID=1094350 RepID=A0A9P5CYF1_9HYPO|nr:beta-fructofuranosidase [Geosmithia morbida]KAF4120348.1 beta-fructofuranosidase [Geosmithia morbida]